MNLVNQHKSIEDILQVAQEVETFQERRELLFRLNSHLTMHFYLEETCLYPILRRFDSLHRQINSLIEQHMQIRTALDKSLSAVLNVKLYQDSLFELQEMFENHIKNEEAHLFIKAQKLLKPSQLRNIHNKMELTLKEVG